MRSMDDDGSEIRPVPGFAGYFVSEAGQVFSTVRGFHYRLKPGRTGRGYLSFVMVVGGKKTSLAVHRAVALAFIDNPRGLRCVNHKDANKRNNHRSNLEWCTQRENTDHAVANNLYANCGSHWAKRRAAQV